ncbi:YibE/F family protein [Lapidilactobacillus achengensis]|uniref:YibE/F family protein n=1 Tax=Lapidilactobacillus achengensis TaxID=2486000 RepID=A0ABW1USS6_9LACO|nr:YibE/F family protein [Lapidilactobacillus achengensis]
MSTMTALLLVLLALIVLVGGTAGLKSYLSILINFCLIFMAAWLIAGGANIWLIAAIFVPLKLATIVYLGTNEQKLADQAFLSSLLVTVIIVLLIFALTWLGQAVGLGNQDDEDLIGLATAPGIDYLLITALVAIFSTLGAISEAAVAMNAGLLELLRQTPTITPAAYQHSAQQMGQDILGTAINTILFGFFGSNLALFIWYLRLNYSLTQLLNDKLFVQEVLVLLESIIGVLLIVPLTTWLIGWRKNYEAKRRNNKTTRQNNKATRSQQPTVTSKQPPDTPHQEP